MILLLLSIFILILFIVFIFIKVKYRFWTLQPFYHKYNIVHALGPKMRPINNTVKINRYVNIIDIKTQKISDIDKTEREKIANFIRNHIIQSKNFKYFPTEKNIFSYLDFSNKVGYITIYHKPTFTMENSIIKNDYEYIALVASRPLCVTIKKKLFSIDYLDFLSLHNGYKESDTIYKLIQTHVYNTSTNNVKHNNSLLIKHYKKPFIIKSLTSFKLVCYDISSIKFTRFLHPMYKIIELGTIHASLLNTFLQQQKSCYDCIIIPELSNIFALIKSKNIMLYGTVVNSALISLYVYKNSVTCFAGNSTTIEKEGKPNTVLCIGALIDNKYKDILFTGFLFSLQLCLKYLDSRYLFIETLSKNIIINNALSQTCKKIFDKKGHYILYNYLSPYIKSSKCFILC